MANLRIVAVCIVAAVIYGIVHDQITARLCVEYFTVGHPPIFSTDDPTLLGLGWGVVATWWVGLLLGVPLAVAARAGNWPKRDARSLVRPIAILLGIMAVCATIAGFIGHSLTANGTIQLAPWLAGRIAPEKHAWFLTAGFAHGTSYAVGGVGGVVLILLVFVTRYRESKRPPGTARTATTVAAVAADAGGASVDADAGR